MSDSACSEKDIFICGGGDASSDNRMRWPLSVKSKCWCKQKHEEGESGESETQWKVRERRESAKKEATVLTLTVCRWYNKKNKKKKRRRVCERRRWRERERGKMCGNTKREGRKIRARRMVVVVVTSILSSTQMYECCEEGSGGRKNGRPGKKIDEIVKQKQKEEEERSERREEQVWVSNFQDAHTREREGEGVCLSEARRWKGIKEEKFEYERTAKRRVIEEGQIE